MKNAFDDDPKSEFGQVIIMDRFRSGKSMSPIWQAEAYWSALRPGTDVPFRSQIDPRGLANILSNTFILERIAPGVARVRLAGQHLNDLAGMEVRGMPVTAFFTGESRAEIGAVLEQVFDIPAVAELTLTGMTTRGGPTALEARMTLMPLKSDLGVVDRALGVLVSDGPLPNAPGRFAIAASRLRPVSGEKTVVPRPEAPVSQPVQQTGLAEDQAPLTGRAPHLRVVK